jgi:heterodisulfide reductase subunit A2
MPARIGVYVCECGPNIKDALDTARVVAVVRDMPEVVHAKSFHLLCSKQGTSLIKEDIETHSLDRIVVAGCSPKEHERTFRESLKHLISNKFWN